MFNSSMSTRRGGAVAMATLGLGAVVITQDPRLVTVGGPTWSGPARLRVSGLCLAAAACLYLLWRLYKLLFEPLLLVRSLEDVGYLAEHGRSKAQAANEVRRRRKVGDLPPVYPNGWYRVLDSTVLDRGQVKSVTVLGQEVAVFRGQEGQAFVLDAYCPHLGANLAVGGKVVGNCVECPFHGWQFDGNDGKCVKIPYSKKVPEVAKVRRWHSCEVNGHIMLWFHCDGEEPGWTVPEKQEITSGEWVYRGRTEHVINAHIQEIPENAGDIAHLNYLHTAGIVSGTDLRYTNNKLFEFFQHDWTAHWEPNTESSRHISKMFLKHKIFLFGHHFPLLDAQVLAQQIGPGLVLLDFEKFSIGRGTIVQCVTPVEPLLQLVTHTIYYQANVLPLIPKFILSSERIQFERDVMIWNNKRYVSKPLIVKEDSAIRKHRRWFSQFYSQNSPQLQYQSDTLDF